MTDFLLFTLYAPLTSWGDIAVGESRGSWDRPSRSAVLGLLAAALGIVREDQSMHDSLESGYGVAIRLDLPGVVLSDYHTAQTVAAAAVKRAKPRTRAALLACGDRQTILSRRTYRQDASATAAIWARERQTPWPLDEIAEALRRPAFVLYAGRKANTFGLPLDPAIVTADSIAGAFSDRPSTPRGLESSLLTVRGQGNIEVSHDPIGPTAAFTSGLRPFRRDVRRDVPTHRSRWQFTERAVEVGLLEGTRTVRGDS